MSNRLAAFHATDRVELGAQLARPSRWTALLHFARSESPQDGFALSPHIRRDLGLADAIAHNDSRLAFEARRLGF